MEIHPVAKMFPPLNELELSNLVARVKVNGQSEPIVCHQGQILDGRDIFYACGVAGITPTIEEYNGPDPIAFVVEKNLARHQLNPSQRALIAAQLCAGPKLSGYARKLRPAGDVTLERAAELMGVSEATTSLARRVLDRATPAQLAAVRAGYASVNKLGLALRGYTRTRPRPAGATDEAATDSQTARSETRRLYVQMWGHLRDGLGHFAELPLPAEVALAARQQDRGLIDRRLEKTIQWLEEFRNVWRSNGNHREDAA